MVKTKCKHNWKPQDSYTWECIKCGMIRTACSERDEEGNLTKLWYEYYEPYVEMEEVVKYKKVGERNRAEDLKERLSW